MNIKAKLLMTFGITVIFLLLLGGVTFWGIARSNADIEDLYTEHLLGIEKLGKINEMLRENRIQLLLSIQHDSRLPSSKVHDHPTSLHTEKVGVNIEEIAKLWKSYQEMPGKEAEQKKLAESFAEAKSKMERDGVVPTRQAILDINFDEAVRLTVQVLNPLAFAAIKASSDLIAAEQKAAQESYEKSQHEFRTVKIVSSACIILAILITAIISLTVIRSITRGAALLQDASSRMAGGDLTAAANVSGSDELGQIARSFNTMRESFAALIGQVTGTASQVASAAHQLMATSEQIATGAEEVACQASTVATAGEEMSATSGDIAQNCQMAAEGSHQASSAAAAGAEVVEKTVQVMGRIATRVHETAKSVESLGSRSDQIGEIIGTIQDIADQTNLLALNAAIEAARAGEQGRGFAVVADEVRALAERTTKATREIGEMIKAIQSETKGAVAAMEEGVREVESGTAEAAKSGHALQEILEQINAVTMQVNQVATAAEEQTATTSEISSNIHQITDVVQETAKGAQESATAANQLATLAEDLQRLVGQFKL